MIITKDQEDESEKLSSEMVNLLRAKLFFFTPKLQVMHLILMAVNNKSHIRLKLLHSYQIKT